ncbi:kinase [Thraustotheca clavata]|uniref:Kinase n=1 Tax=Thraustotheca clavata TaxID=74557 RepID=A0A1V9YSV0_9STRA|nr:kinase [Thraustotheca clavata]
MNLGDLRSYLVQKSPQQFTKDQKFQVLSRIVSVLIYLHTYDPPIIHRDLKSRNVLLDTAKGTKLTDFGASQSTEEDETMTSGIGTFQWMAPEVISGTKYSSAVDIYSFGIILSVLCTHQVPYSNLLQNGNSLSQLYIMNGVCAGWLRPSFEGTSPLAHPLDILLIFGVIAGTSAIIFLVIIALICVKRKQKLKNQAQETKTESTNYDLNLFSLRPYRLELSDLTVASKKPLASGAHGEVWLGMYGQTQVAIKRVKIQDPPEVQAFINEIALWSQFSSDHVIQFIGVSRTRPIEIECVVEYMNLGDSLKCILSIVYGLVYLHTYTVPIVHRDLKSRNALLDSDKGTKPADFGTSKAIEDEDNIMTSRLGHINGWHVKSWLVQLIHLKQTFYSFGIILSEFSTHQVPYSNMDPNGTLDVPLWVKDVAMQCLQLNDTDRPTALKLTAILHKYKPKPSSN